MSTKCIVVLTASILPFIVGCHREVVDEKVGCNCEGKAAKVVRDVPAQLIKLPARTVLLKEEISYNGLTINSPILCDTSIVAGLAVSEAGVYDYLVSGNVRPPCDNRGLPLSGEWKLPQFARNDYLFLLVKSNKLMLVSTFSVVPNQHRF